MLIRIKGGNIDIHLDKSHQVVIPVKGAHTQNGREGDFEGQMKIEEKKEAERNKDVQERKERWTT